jgi:hypothetical protein
MLPKANEAPAYTPIGWQPFDRPEQQRANAYRLAVGEDFAKVASVSKFRFTHNWSVSKKIYEQFEGGDLLFPGDPLSEYAEYVNDLTAYKKADINMAADKFRVRTGKKLNSENINTLLKQKGLKIEAQNTAMPFDWNFDDQLFEKKLEQLAGRIKLRLTADHYQG